MESYTSLVPIYVALVTGVFTGAGWVVTNYLSKKKEDRIGRLEATKRHLERQIEEFYGPLFNLIHQIAVCNHVQDAILTSSDPYGNSIRSSSDADTVRQFFQDNHFVPLHNEL